MQPTILALNAERQIERVRASLTTLTVDEAELILELREQSEGRNPLSARFHTILKELGKLHDKKQADYGKPGDPLANVRASEDWGVRPWVGAMIRLSDKIKRLQSYARTGRLLNEGVIDSMNDIPVYGVIAQVLFEQEQGLSPGRDTTEDSTATSPSISPEEFLHGR
jgi:hypothetical protein